MDPRFLKAWPLLFGGSTLLMGFIQAPPSGPNPPGTTPLHLQAPPGFPPLRLPQDNPLTVEGVALGRRLFNDVRLSGNNSISCASCHKSPDAFSDEGNAVSKGVNGTLGTRNAMALFNLNYAPNYFWDGRAANLRVQAVAPIQNVLEMHDTLPDVVRKLTADKSYLTQFAIVFGTPGINSDRLSKAIEQYELTILSGNSKFDLSQRGGPALSAQEQRGLVVFSTPFNPKAGQFGGDCARCHGGPLFTNFAYRNNGLDAKPADPGREDVTGLAQDFGQFKTPSLRNLTATGPYMHDGRFATLDQVVAHYSNGIVPSPTLDPGLARQPGGVHLSAQDQAALVAFLKTLVDPQFAAAPSAP